VKIHIDGHILSGIHPITPADKDGCLLSALMESDQIVGAAKEIFAKCASEAIN